MLVAACASTKVEPGYYRVQPGDTLYKVAQRNNQSVANLQRWNTLSNADVINAGQVLRVAPPVGGGSGAAMAQSAPTKKTTAKKTTAKKTPAKAAPAQAAPVTARVTSVSLAWPAAGKVARVFDGSKSNGILIANAAGTPVTAAAGGTVAYAGRGLRGYGNLVIIKHNTNVLTIYAHNRSLLVKEGQSVKQGQKIAEMGDTDSTQVGLYFEIRQNGTPTDPQRSLPKR